jgi:acyl-coenzyme A synthetase/AMP-(fatty) acid ligase
MINKDGYIYVISRSDDIIDIAAYSFSTSKSFLTA